MQMDVALIVILLSIMEVSLSFDNAIVNASVLQNMSEKWQQRFLTWGILVAVVGMRLAFPVLIVSSASGLNLFDVVDMVINDGRAYGEHLTAAHGVIAAFGGMFLLMVFMDFIIDEKKQIHWMGLEKFLVSIKYCTMIKSIIMSICLFVISFYAERQIFNAAIIGCWAYIILDLISSFLSTGAKTGLLGFVYLEVLDASFSLDGVISAFSMTNNIIIIMIGLGIGAAVIRTLTVRLVRGKTLQEYIYLEHGAHWGIGALSIIMLASIWVHVPEVITGLIGVSFIGLALLSSIKEKKNGKA